MGNPTESLSVKASLTCTTLAPIVGEAGRDGETEAFLRWLVGTSREQESAMDEGSGFVPPFPSTQKWKWTDIKEGKIRIGQAVLCRTVVKKKKRQAFGYILTHFVETELF